MADLLFIATLVAFFALMVAFVRLCESIVGKDEGTSSSSRARGGDATTDSTDSTDSTHSTDVANTSIEEVPA